MNHKLRLPSPAMSVAVLALFVALGGTGYAVSKLPNNSVGTAQLKNNAVTSAKVKNGTLVSTDFAAGQLKPGPAGPAGPAGPKGETGPAGTGAALAFAATSSDAPTITTSATLSTLGSTTIKVPADTTATVIATFSAESRCVTAGGCVVRLFVDGDEMNPEDGTNFVFDSPAVSASAYSDFEAHSITRLRRGVGAGDHTVSAQIQATGGAGFRLDDWTLVAVAYKQ
ncbi:MAG: hypothetical protein U0R50_11145 [Gaiellales bacterium]